MSGTIVPIAIVSGTIVIVAIVTLAADRASETASDTIQEKIFSCLKITDLPFSGPIEHQPPLRGS